MSLLTEILIDYFGKRYGLRRPAAEDRWQNHIGAGGFETLTGIGNELFPIAGAKYNGVYV